MEFNLTNIQNYQNQRSGYISISLASRFSVSSKAIVDLPLK
jgi:hypothetical protein